MYSMEWYELHLACSFLQVESGVLYAGETAWPAQTDHSEDGHHFWGWWIWRPTEPYRSETVHFLISEVKVGPTDASYQGKEIILETMTS